MAGRGDSLPELQVAAGILRAPDGRVLVSQRPPDKPHGGAWEFPGGKIAAAETPLQGLVRELREELGIDVRVARHLVRYRHNYADKIVRLHVWLVPVWTGEPQGLEGQPLRWLEASELMDQGLLPADKLIADLLQQPTAVMQCELEESLR